MILRTRPSSISRARPDTAAAGVVGHAGQVPGALLDQPLDQRVGLADRAEAADQHGGAVLDAGHGLGHGLNDLVDHRGVLPRRNPSAGGVAARAPAVQGRRPSVIVGVRR